MDNKEFETIDAYIQQQPPLVQPILQKVRTTLSHALPQATERIAWGMPTFHHEQHIIHFAAAKHHLGIYPGPDAILHFKEQLSTYNTSKGAIQFKFDEPIPYELISQIAVWCYETGKHH
mgnify:CR=1 FL=1